MKRSWIGLGILLVLLAAGLGVTMGMTQIHEPISADLEQAAAAVLAGDWDKGAEVFGKAKEDWEKWAHVRASFADHTPTEEIDAQFAELKVYCTAREDAAFAASCMELARKVAAVGEAHELVWWNVL